MNTQNYEDAIDKTINTVNTAYNTGRRVGYVLMGLFLLLISVVLFAWGAYLYKSRTDATETYIKTEGIVTELRKVKGNADVGITYAPVIKFKDKSGKEYVHESSNSSDPPAYDISEKVEILYNKTDPEEAFINSFGEKWTGIIAFITCGVILFLIGTWMIFTAFRRRKYTSESVSSKGETSSVSIG